MRTLEQVARRLVWWKSPEDALKDKHRFLAQVMALGDLEDTRAMLREFLKEDLKFVLDHPPAGVFTPPAWNYWHVVLGKTIKPLPKRFKDEETVEL